MCGDPSPRKIFFKIFDTIMGKSIPKKPKRLAIFDIDGTIFRSSLLIELTEAFIHDGIFPLKARKIYAKDYQNWLDRKGEYQAYLDKVIAAFDKHTKGLPYRVFASKARKVVGFHQNRIYRYTRDLVRDLKKQGYFLLAISGSPKDLVEAFAKKLGFEKVYGRILETDKNGKLTGKTLYEDLIHNKAKILDRVLERHNVTLKKSVGVGDTESDIPFLKKVERAIAFNPNSKLYRQAKRLGWQIAVERKDVIYKL